MSEVLNRKRRLSLRMVKSLHDALKIPYESLLGKTSRSLGGGISHAPGSGPRTAARSQFTPLVHHDSPRERRRPQAAAYLRNVVSEGACLRLTTLASMRAREAAAMPMR